MSNLVTDSDVDVNALLDNDDVVMSAQEFQSMGLDPEGVYRLDIKKMAVVTKTVKTGDNKGQKYKAIDAEIQLVERFGGTSPGLLEYPIRIWDYNFGVRGKKGERFRELFIAVFGPIKQAKTETVSLNDMASALVGADTVWTTLYHRRKRNEPDEIEQVLGWAFSSDPSSLKAPKPFAERDKFVDEQ